MSQNPETPRYMMTSPFAAAVMTGAENAPTDRLALDKAGANLLAALAAVTGAVVSPQVIALIVEREQQLREDFDEKLQQHKCCDETVAALVAVHLRHLNIKVLVKSEIERQIAALRRRARLISLLWVFIGALLGALTGVGFAVWGLASVKLPLSATPRLD